MPIELVQEVTFEADSLTLFEPMLRAAADAIGAEQLARCRPEPVWEYPSHAAAYLMSFRGVPPLDVARWQPPERRPPPHYLPICVLSRFGSHGPGDDAIAVTGRADAVARAIELVRAADLADLTRATGDGPFAGCDGSTAVGYRLHGARDRLVVSLCHVYYSK
ncbi:MAG: hypothetical protein H6709_20615 [Kofleriaceae bacterium]|nr:hypothetical protein [Myxococcales bacterium]MCB9560724.1 hypothetical protein [Kofleriaceae bacterium]MCB9574486.1 hypothetical protein [Kofleriaceae bacterium]